MQFQLDYAILKNHQLELRAYNTLFKTETEESEFFISATYRVRLGVPVKQIMQAGDLSGVLTNDSGEPLSGIVVGFLNKTTITDQNGEFKFRSIPPGTHLLTIDNSQFEIDEMPNIPMPLKVDILEDQETKLNIGITKGARLKGQFSLLAADGSDFKGADKPSLGNIIVELKSDFKTYRITSNSKGEFSFPLVLPTKWVLKIYVNSLPDGFEIKKSITELDFESGDKKDLAIEVFQKKRKIIFKSQNISLSSSGGGLKPLSSSIKLKSKPKSSPKPKSNSELHTKSMGLFYSVQIAAFSKQVDTRAPFFDAEGFVFEKQIDNFYKYFIGELASLQEAVELKNRLKKKYKGAFVVGFENNKPFSIKEQ